MAGAEVTADVHCTVWLLGKYVCHTVHLFKILQRIVKKQLCLCSSLMRTLCCEIFKIIFLDVCFRDVDFRLPLSGKFANVQKFALSEGNLQQAAANRASQWERRKKVRAI